MPAERRRIWIVPAVLCACVAALWVFPEIWYSKHGAEQAVWFAERSEIPGWKYTEEPVSESAERILVADRTINGEFRSGERAVRVFSAKRYEEKANEIGLFVHTPDRCWVESGWTIEPVAPDVVEVIVHGVRLTMERRLFNLRGERELVYFCGLVGGQALPYRLDHNLSVGMRTALKERQDTAGAAARVSDMHFWKRLGTSFASRRALDGPKEFIRISTPVNGDLAEADELLREFLGQWLVEGNYQQERASFRAMANR
jgi:hypothetical protein